MNMRELRTWVALAVLAAGAGASIHPARAEESPAVSAAEFASLKQRLADMERQLAEVSGQAAVARQEVGSLPWPEEPNDHCSGIVAGAELAVLKAHQSGGDAEGLGYATAPRLWIGWTGASGLGLRVRWFEYQVANPEAPSFTTGIGLDTIDLEMCDTFRFAEHWSGQLSGGLRYAQYRESYATDETSDYFGSLGPVVGLEFQRHLSDRLSLFTLGRESFLFGDYRASWDHRDTVYAVSELQLGSQWRKPLQGTNSLIVRCAFEGQFWSMVSGGLGHGAFGLVGGTFAVGFER